MGRRPKIGGADALNSQKKSRASGFFYIQNRKQISPKANATLQMLNGELRNHIYSKSPAKNWLPHGPTCRSRQFPAPVIFNSRLKIDCQLTLIAAIHDMPTRVILVAHGKLIYRWHLIFDKSDKTK
jgi:hypothetical protein